MAELTNKEIQRNRMLTYFIEATQQIIEDEGIESVSIRKVAKRAGYNSATIYNYFKDIDQLILLASMKYLRNYNIALSKHIRGQGDPYKLYLDVWDFFCDASFEYPQVFYNLFYNRHSGQINEIMDQYYSVFPDELGQHSPIIEEMFTGQTVLERNAKLMQPMVEAGYLSEKDLDTVNYISVCCFREILLEKCNNPTANTKKLKENMRYINEFLIGKCRQCCLQNQ